MVDSVIAKLRERAVDPSMASDMANGFPRAVPPPLDNVAIAEAESALGRPLPPLLRDAYLLVGNGGFGPGYGLLPLRNDGVDSEALVDLYLALVTTDPEDQAWSWPAELLPFCDWGCAIRSCVDTASPDGTVLTFDPGERDVGQPMSGAFARTHSSLNQWFTDWLAGVDIWDLMFEPDPSGPRVGINPFTKEPIEIPSRRLRRS